MEPLNNRMLNKALGFAAEHDSTSIAIVLDCMTTLVAMRRSIVDRLNSSMCTSNHNSISFSNGSTIRLFTVNDGQNFRGHRSNIILVHSLITDTLSLGRIQMAEHSQHGHPGKIYKYVYGLEDYYELAIDDITFRSPSTCCSTPDFGDFELSSEILDYIGGLCG